MADIDAPLAWRMQQDGYLMQINELTEENTKLRELCKDIWGDFNHDYLCSWEGSCRNPLCKYNGECSYENRMRELGVEADE